MPFEYDLSDELKQTIKKLKKKDHKRVEIIYKKINQITSCDEFTIDHFKNLRYDLSDEKRVHIDKSFVLSFKADKKRKFILFTSFDHHDDAFERKGPQTR